MLSHIDGPIAHDTDCHSQLKAELNLFKHHFGPKIKLTPPIVHTFFRNGQLKFRRRYTSFNWHMSYDT